ncbi:hypothetical protein [uncultured Clostridium sp.]|uniref:hypothetical protein n=1 Tax=uncultured Clostridium sp. TaxID=59620 RepID=UPI0025F6DE90|nr:hypothetical protein [uncultured Clostridium sp.]
MLCKGSDDFCAAFFVQIKNTGPDEMVLLFPGRHFWNRKCRKKTWWQQEFAVFKCEATANSVTGHVCVNSNETLEEVVRFTMMELTQNKQIDIIEENTMEKC